jgi:hypothetical protein
MLRAVAAVRALLTGRAAAGRSPGACPMSDSAATSDPTAHPTCTPTVRLSVGLYPQGELPRVSVDVTLKPPADVKARADAVGLPALRDAFTARCRAAKEVERWQVLRQQIAAAEAAAAKAEEAIAQADAAKALLERELSPDLANELRRVRVEAEAAVVARDVAARDLAEVRHLIAGHFVPAAAAVNSVALGTFTPRALQLSDARAEAERNVKEAVAFATARIEQVLAEVLGPPVAALLVAHRADREAWDGGGDRIRDEVAAELLGPMPAGVRRVGPSRYELIPPAPPVQAAEPDAPAPAPATTVRRVGTVYPGM